MDFTSTLLLAVGLSMDAFAVSVTNGLVVERLRFRFALKMAVCFGVAQAVMPLIGYVLGYRLASHIHKLSHIIAFGLLAFVGIKMIIDTMKDCSDDECCRPEPGIRTILLMAIATSIDALAAGVSLAFAPQTPHSISIFSAICMIGIVTTCLCVVGAYLGRLFGCRLKRGAGILGGAALVAIGIKMLFNA